MEIDALCSKYVFFIANCCYMQLFLDIYLFLKLLTRHTKPIIKKNNLKKYTVKQPIFLL